VASYQHDQAELLRRIRPNDFLTHNGSFFQKPSITYGMARDLDLFAFDNYPCSGQAPVPPPDPATMARGFRDRS